jgi:hypothetical protein
MSNPNRKFLEFNGKDIEFVFAEGKWWVAVKPICEALGIHYKFQHEAILGDDFLSQLSREHGIVAADGKLRKMTCLPERYIYGWIFALRSDSEELRKYKMKCYDILFEYFEGVLTRRQETLADRTVKQARKETLEQELAEDDRYIELKKLKTELSQLNSDLKLQDKELVERQGSLFEN